jgi:phosphatidate cytidylyltransferase
VTRVLSGAVLLILAVVIVWFSPAALFFAIAQLILILAFVEYVGLARASGFSFPAVPAAAAAMLTCSAFTGTVPVALDVALLSALLVLGVVTMATWQGGRDALGHAAVSLFPALYLGLPLGAMVAVREVRGREALFLLILTVSASDTAQYYSGRAFGRQPLAPTISPKKTLEGAIGGLVFGALVLVALGAWWLPTVPILRRAVVGVAIVALGISGDLFESMLKRSAGVKDSSSLIPGHGGILDRIDALLFAAPAYYVVLKYI